MQLFAVSTISALKRQIEPNRPKSADWQRLLARVDRWCADSAELPNQSGGWIHNYICPVHWMPLVYDGNLAKTHVCPVGDSCEGLVYDEAWLAWRHREFADMSREIAIAYALTGEPRYLAEVERVLRHYVAFYTNFEGADSAESWMLTARVFNQALTEALWAIPLIHAYDLVSADLSSDFQQQIEHEFLRPLAGTMAIAQDSLIEKDHVESNYMAWFNAALGCLGYTLGEPEYIARAIDGDGGFIKHISAGVLADGKQYEVTPYYHNFVVLAYQILAEAAASNGRDLYAVRGEQGQSITSMCQALTQCTLPDGTIADLGDGSYWIDSVYDRELIEVYEIASAHNPNISPFTDALTHAYARSQRKRDGWAALLYGSETIASHSPAATLPPLQLLPDAGVAILNASPQLSAVALFGAHRGSHSHGDQLSLQVWPFSNDAGCVLYGIPARREWYQDSYAHNVLVVDGQSQNKFSQAMHQLDGRLLSLTATDAYPDCAVSRVVEIDGDRLVDRLSVSATSTGSGPAESIHTYDSVFHVDGELQLTNLTTGAIDETVGSSVAAQQIFLTEKASRVHSAEFQINHNGQIYTLTLTGSEPFDLLLGTAPGTSWNPTERRRVIIGRTVGTTQTYQTTIQHQT
ncbi:MAG: alginate lyase family protein [Candidatus Promineifilaceae bacterium]